MAGLEDNVRQPADPPIAPTPAPPLAVIFPGLDRLSRSSFRKGTVSRSRITRAILLLVSIATLIGVLVAVSIF